MSRPWLLCIGLLMGFVLGITFSCLFVLGNRSSSLGSDSFASKASEQNNGALPSVPESRAGQDKALKSQIAQLEEQLSRQKAEQETTLMADRLALFKKNGGSINFEPFSDDFKPSPALSDILKLSQQEKEAIEEALVQAKRETTKLEDSKLKLIKKEGKSITYQIPAYPEGAAVQDSLREQLSSALGEDRAGLFMDYSKNAFVEQFSAFGKQTTQLEITRDNLADGTPNYTLTETFSGGPNGEWSQSHPIGDVLPARYADLLQIAPDK